MLHFEDFWSLLLEQGVEGEFRAHLAAHLDTLRKNSTAFLVDKVRAGIHTMQPYCTTGRGKLLYVTPERIAKGESFK